MNKLLATCAVVSSLSLATLAIGMVGLVYVQVQLLEEPSEPIEDTHDGPKVRSDGSCDQPLRL